MNRFEIERNGRNERGEKEKKSVRGTEIEGGERAKKRSTLKIKCQYQNIITAIITIAMALATTTIAHKQLVVAIETEKLRVSAQQFACETKEAM